MDAIILYFEPSDDVKQFIEKNKSFKVFKTLPNEEFNTLIICDIYTLLLENSVKANKIIIWKTVNVNKYMYKGIDISNECLLENLTVDEVIKSKNINGVGVMAENYL